MMKMLLVSLVLFTVACNPSGEEPIASIAESASSEGTVELLQSPLLVLDYQSALSQEQECKLGQGSYTCLISETLTELTLFGPIVVRPPRPRHCPTLICTDGPSLPPGTGPICEPDKCRSLFKEHCFDNLKDLQLAVKAIDPSYVHASLIRDKLVIATTNQEDGGSVLPGPDCSSAILDFGKSIPEIAGPGTFLNIRTSVMINDEVVETNFSIEL
ncbi:MAG: hypothetical protein AAFO69_14325 [Bacteroidota bacterium]